LIVVLLFVRGVTWGRSSSKVTEQWRVVDYQILMYPLAHLHMFIRPRRIISSSRRTVMSSSAFPKL